MPNPPTINAVLPTIVSNKASNTPVESKSNSTFNQVLKNEVANKTKKTVADAQKNTSNEHKTLSESKNTSINPQDKSESNEVAIVKEMPDDEPIAIANSDPSSLLNFVNNISALSQVNSLAPSSPQTTASSESSIEINLSNAGILSQSQATELPTLLATEKVQDRENSQRFSTLPETTIAKSIQEDAGADADTIKTDLGANSTTSATQKISSETNLQLQINRTIAPDQTMPEQTGAAISNQQPLLTSQIANQQRVSNEVPTQTVVSESSTSAIDKSKEILQFEVKTLQTTGSDNFSTELIAQFSQKQQDAANLNQAKIIDQFNETVSKPEISNISQLNPIRAEISHAPVLSDHIAPRVGSKGWDQAMGQKIVWMVAGGEQSAQLTLNPPDLGPVQIVLSISDNFVDASFISSHLDVREAIESAAPKLREMMDSAGISLSGFSVSAESAQSNNQFGAERSTRGGGSQAGQAASLNGDTDISTIPLTARNSSQELGLVDTFA
jgi:flagellar hook-length control protein FliK